MKNTIDLTIHFKAFIKSPSGKDNLEKHMDCRKIKYITYDIKFNTTLNNTSSLVVCFLNQDHSNIKTTTGF